MIHEDSVVFVYEFTLKQAVKPQRGSIDVAVPFFF